jgi:two-component system, LuxR family, response regulator FixJ
MTQDALVYLIDPEHKDRTCIEKKLEEVNLEFQSFSDADALLPALEPNRLGCVLSELKLGSATAFQLVRRLRHCHSSLPVILLTSYATVPLAVQAFKAGLFDVLEKPCEAFHLWECATRAFESHGHDMREARNCNSIKNRIAHLSRQELQVMQMLMDGEPNKRIAAQLSVSPRTIVFRRKSLMQKMHAKSVAELACMVHSVTSQNIRSSAPELTSLLDVFIAASMCGASDESLSHNGNGSGDGFSEPNEIFRRPR